jgi:NAD(P)-dependent dehydrogenase (short-subunit alcohol dehydrogenase family)
MELDLKDRVVVVTGATGGIGSAICRAFLCEGSIVVAMHRSGTGKLEPLMDHARSRGIPTERIVPVRADLSDPESTAAAVETIIGRFGRIDVLVNCAGSALELPFLLTEDAQWDEVLEVNLSALARFTRLVVRQMFMARRGAVVNIASVLGARFGRGTVAYAAAKAGIIRFSQALAMEVGSRGVRVNTVCPGIIDTPMSRQLTRRLEQRLPDMVPLCRIGNPEEVGPAVVFLSSESAASYITGTTIVVDGGMTI